MPAADRGCLVIADISGYTSYLLQTELEHANDVLADLTDTLVEHLAPTLTLSKLEGDAVFAYALEVEAAILLDVIDTTYFAFRTRRRTIQQATTCECDACRLIPRLDLKFVVHHGRFVRSRIGGGEELTGSDVVVVHRLLKNSVVSDTGLVSYAFLTEACIEGLGVDPTALGLPPFRQTYEDIGEVAGFLVDLEANWQAAQERLRVYVGSDEAEFEVVQRLPAPPSVVWEAYTSPRRRVEWQTDFLRIDQENPSGRPGPGSVNHCMHGEGVIIEEILDWRPFDYFTHRVTVPMLGPWEMTIEFEDLGEAGTEVRMRPRRLTGRKRLTWALMRRMMLKNIDENGARLLALLEKEATDSVVVE